jgi:hypothetical protein
MYNRMLNVLDELLYGKVLVLALVLVVIVVVQAAVVIK